MSVTCQVCGSSHSMSHVLSLGYMPPPNDMATAYDPKPQTWLPTEMWFCSECELAQLGYVPDQTVAFPNDYPYTSGATPALRNNFEDLARKCTARLGLKSSDLVVDIGSNDGTLLSCFDKCLTLGVEPTDTAKIANSRGIRTEQLFFTEWGGKFLARQHGNARLITCANCFAHMPNIHNVIEGIKNLLADDGMFVSESHYLIDLINTLQYDTIYAEHLRYYTIRSIAKLLAGHGLKVVWVEHIPTHGGSIRVYAQKDETIRFEETSFDETPEYELTHRLKSFADSVQFNRLAVLSHLHQVKSVGGRVVGIGAPSRGSTVINYLHLDASIVEYVAEQPHSLKVGRFMPGTDIPVVDEKRFYDDPPDAAILFSWHLADTLVPKLWAKGYRGQIILPCSATIINEPTETVQHFRIPPNGGVSLGAA